MPDPPDPFGDASEAEWPNGYTRRQFLKITGGGAALSASGLMSKGQWLRAVKRATAAIAAPAFADIPGTPDLLIHGEREADLVTLDFAFYGFAVRSSPPAIVPTRDDNFVLVQFPPQAIGEAVYLQFEFLPNQRRLLVDPAPILSDLAGPSRLVFSLPGSQTIPLPTMTVADLLDWRQWRLYVPEVATDANIRSPGNAATPSAPAVLRTQIECPYALYLSPTDRASFTSRRTPLTSTANVTGCWAAVLAGPDRRVVATYARDFAGGNATPETNIDYRPRIVDPH